MKAFVRSSVTRAKMEVEVEGNTEEIAAIFDGVLASVARHFPALEVEIAGQTVAQDEAEIKVKK